MKQQIKKKNYYLYPYQIERVERYAKQLTKKERKETKSMVRISGSVVIQQLIDELPE